MTETIDSSAMPGTPESSPGVPPRPPIARIVAVALGGLGIVVGLAALVAGGLLVWAYGTQRDDGFFTTPTERLETVTYAITSDRIDLGADPSSDEHVPDLGDLATVRLQADPVGDTPVFVGIGPTDDVDAYLDGVAHARVDRIAVGPGKVDYSYVDGGAPARRPGDEGFWAARADGAGRQTLDWAVEPGQWSVVVMNADASPAVGVRASVGVKANWVLPVGLGVLGFGLVSLLGATVLLLVGAVGLAHRLQQDPPPGPARRGAVALTGHLDEPSRWLWIVKPILVIPHLVVLFVLWIGVVGVSIIAFFSILFTRRYPRALFDYTTGVLRWSWRVGFYSFSALGTDRYPPFRLSDGPQDAAAPYPADLTVAYAPELSRRLVLVKWWLLAIPHFVILGIVLGSSTAGQSSAPGLLYLLVAFAALALLFTTRYPAGLFDFVLGLDRWVYRVLAYVLLLTDEYPPFRLDQGPDEPPLDPPIHA
jgi:hypothetical protein